MEESLMKYVVLDLEMNAVSENYKKVCGLCRKETIEIGAVLLDEKYEEIGSFVTLIKPEFNTRIEKRYEKLTGIKTDMVEKAPGFGDALKMFFSWCNSVQDKIQIIQWSENDYIQISREIKLKKCTVSKENEMYISEEWLDFQKEYGRTLGVDKNISLKDAVMFAGEEFLGHQHDALIDARNTANLLEIVRDEKKCKEALKNVMEALRPKEAFSMKDFFDFSSLGVFI